MSEPLKPREFDALAPTATPGATPSAADLDRTATQPDAPQFANTDFEVELGTFGRYRVLKKLGQGGMGAVFLATDTALARKVALKVMLPQYAANPDARERFLREARTAAMVHSDHVVTIFDVGGEGDETPFIAMEYLIGAPLDQYLKHKGELPLAHVLRVARETALGLSAAHALGLVHRDIKPANLWLEAPKGRVKLLDFGLARVEDDDTHLTGTGAVVGTPSYMSPEQARGEKVDPRTDLFSVGVMLYRLTTGKMPFSGPTTMAVLTSLAIDTPPPPRAINPNVPEALDAIIVKLLSKKPEGRFQSAAELVEAIREVEHPKASGPVPVVVPVPALVVEARAQNVWEGIDDSASRAVPVGDSAQHEGTELDVDAVPPAPETRRKPERASRLPLLVAGAVLVLACAALAAVLMRPANGTLVVESDDADAELVLKRDGAVVRDRTRERELVLPAGAYAVELADPRPGAKLSADRVDVPKNGTGRVRVIVEKKVVRPPVPPVPPVQPPVQPPAKPSAEREAAELVISLGGYVRLHTNDRANVRGIRDVAALPGGNFALAQVHIDSRDKPRVLADAVLEKFKDCKALTHLNLHGCTVTDAGLAHLAGCPQLKELALYGPKVTDAGLAHFKGCALLERLDLQGTGATDAGLAAFKGCAHLKALRLAEMKVSAAGLAQFKDCSQLESLSLEGTPLPAADLAALGGRTELRELDLTGTGVGNDALPHFKGCPALRSVNLARTAVSDAGLVAFKGNAALRELNLSGTEVSGAGLAHLAGCPRLGSLQLAGAKQLTDAALAALKGCPDLYSLNLQGAPLTDAALAHLEGLAGLQVLQLRGTKVTTDAARKLAEKLPDCRIEWSGGAIEPRADPDRKSAEALWGVGLWSIFVNGKEAQGFTAPENMPRERFELRSVYVNRNKSVTDDSFACLQGCRHLVSVQITNVAAGNKTLSYLKDSKHLETLTLYATGVTDEGLKELVGFKDLRALDLTQLPLSEPAVKALAAELPNCTISWKGGTIAPAKK